MKFRDTMAKSSIQQETEFFHQKIGLKYKKGLVYYYIWNTALYGAGT
jgi:hypothetical protein